MTRSQAMEQAIRLNPKMRTKELLEEAERIYTLSRSPKPPSSYGIGKDRLGTLSDASRFRNIGHNVNHMTIPLVRNLVTQTISEFMPEIWEKLPQNSFERAIAISVYENIRKKALGAVC